MPGNIIEIVLKDISATYPLFALQYAAIVGILSIVLLAYRLNDDRAERPVAVYGVVLGVVGYLLTALMQNFLMGVPVKPLARGDLLFFSGMLGGWRGGLIGLVMMVAARFQFAEVTPMLALGIIVEQTSIVACGMLLHRWYLNLNNEKLQIKTVITVWVARTLAQVGAALGAGYLIGVPASTQYLQLVRKLGGAPLAFILVLGLFLLFRIDAQDRRTRALQIAATRMDPISGLANRRSLHDHISNLFSITPQQTRSIISIKVSNYIEMLLKHREQWRDEFPSELSQTLALEPIRGLLATYQPAVFHFGDLELIVVLHGVAPHEVERQGLAYSLQQHLAQHWHSQDQLKAPPQFDISVAACDKTSYRNAAAALRDLSLHFQSAHENSHGIRYLFRTTAESAAIDAQLQDLLLDWINTGTPPMAYQPKYHMEENRVVGAEALLRAIDFQGRAVSPTGILTLATRLELLSAFEWCTIERVTDDAIQLHARGLHMPLCVNISSASLVNPGFAARVRDLLTTKALPPSSLAFEFTEYKPIPDIEAVRQNVQIFNDIGIKLSLDDFGTGYSSLSSMAQFNFSEVKIDQGMVNLIAQPRMQSAIQLTIEAAQRYGAQFIAEGVETTEQRDTLLAMGVKIAQGYLFARALSLRDFMDFCTQTPKPTADGAAMLMAFRATRSRHQ